MNAPEVRLPRLDDCRTVERMLRADAIEAARTGTWPHMQTRLWRYSALALLDIIDLEAVSALERECRAIFHAPKPHPTTTEA